jgi:hypothetical protein
VDWVQNLTATPRQMKAGTDLLGLYQQAGVTPDKEIVVYCRTGMRASHTYFALRLLGYPRVRLYDGSYVEWAASPTVPVARSKHTSRKPTARNSSMKAPPSLAPAIQANQSVVLSCIWRGRGACRTSSAA